MQLEKQNAQLPPIRSQAHSLQRLGYGSMEMWRFISFIGILLISNVCLATSNLNKRGHKENILQLAKAISFDRRHSPILFPEELETVVSTTDSSNPPKIDLYGEPSESFASTTTTTTETVRNVQYAIIEGIRATFKHEESAFLSLSSHRRHRTNKKMLNFFTRKYNHLSQQKAKLYAAERIFSLPPIKRGKISFHAIATNVFKSLRQHWNIDKQEYLHSLSTPRMAAIGPLKSGAFFFYTADQRFLIKFIPGTHAHILWQQLPVYHDKILQNSNSLLTRILGLYRINLKHLNVNDVYNVLVIENTFSSISDARGMDVVYDLKGSFINRLAKSDGAATALKDQDWLLSKQKIQLGPARDLFLSQLRADTEWLLKANINDYSLLLGIAYVNAADIEESLADRQLQQVLNDDDDSNDDNLWYSYDGGFVGRTADGGIYTDNNNRVPVYYTSLIDLFTIYNCERKNEFERKAKTPELAELISCIPPVKYHSRFLSKLSEWTA